jgi:ParB-like chromosome segregation protein Spo0J
MRIRDLQVVIVSVSALTPNARNSRKKQLRQIAASISAFGWTNPILVDGDVIGGHGRLNPANKASRQ